MNTYQINRNKLFDDMKAGSISILFAGKAPASSSDSLYPFRRDKNFYYMTGLKREDYILVMMKDEKTSKEVLFINEPNEAVEKWVGRSLTKTQCKDVSGIEDIQYLDRFDQFLNQTVYGAKYSRLYLDLARVHGDRQGLEAMAFANKVQKNYPELSIKNLHKHLRDYRMIKSDHEVELIRKAIALTKDGLEGVMTKLKPGDYEYVAMAEFDYSMMKNGADGNAFETIAASGENATILHYIENDQVMKEGDLILMDLGAQYKEYASDITRTYPISGQFSERQKVIYNLVLKAHDEVIAIMKPGVAFADLNTKCTEVLREGLKAIGLIKEDDELSKYYYHGVSHHMGLDTHDISDRQTDLKAGMVLTVEPGLYIKEEGLGIRIEDDVLITEDGNEVLSADIVRRVEDIERFMAQE